MKWPMILLSVLFSTAVHAQAMKDMEMKAQKGASSPVHKASGVVTKVDAGKSKVTIKHDPVRSLGWPGMTMAFTVKDKAVLGKLAKDKKVDFEFKEEGKDYVITSVK
jgi:Cu(I)/Ag(I) efflux system protein CusF